MRQVYFQLSAGELSTVLFALDIQAKITQDRRRKESINALKKKLKRQWDRMATAERT